jgi:CYTH domain-containing protein
MKQLKKLRQCFIYEQQYFMVESFCNVDGAPSLLRIETTKEGKDVKIPPFVKVLKDVTEDSQYASSTMARLKYKMPEADKKAIKQELASVVVAPATPLTVKAKGET